MLYVCCCIVYYTVLTFKQFTIGVQRGKSDKCFVQSKHASPVHTWIHITHR